MPKKKSKYTPGQLSGTYYYGGEVGTTKELIPPKGHDTAASQQGITSTQSQYIPYTSNNVQPKPPNTPYQNPVYGINQQAPELTARTVTPDPELPPMAIGWKPKRDPNDPAEVPEPDYGGNWWNAWLRKTWGTIYNPAMWGEGLDYEQKTIIKEKQQKAIDAYVSENPWAASMEEYLQTMSLAASMGLQTIVQLPEEKSTAEKAGQESEIYVPKWAKTVFRTGMLGFRVMGKGMLPAVWDSLWTLVLKGETPFRAGFAGAAAVQQVEDEYGVVSTRSLAEKAFKEVLPKNMQFVIPWIGRLADFMPWERALRKGQMAYHYYKEGDLMRAGLSAIEAGQFALPTQQGLMGIMGEGGEAVGEAKTSELLTKVGIEQNLAPIQERMNAVTSLRLAGSQAVYTFAIDGSRYQQFVKAVDAGMRPDLAAEMYMNPWIELLGGMAFDVLNAFGAPTKVPKIATATKEFMKPVDEVAKAWEAVGKAAQAGVDGKNAAKTYKGVFTTVRTLMASHLDNLVKWASDYTLLAPTADAKYIYVTRRINSVLELVTRLSVKSGRIDDAAQFFDAMIKVAVGTEEQALAALPTLHSSTFKNVALSRAGIETMAFFKEMLTQVVQKDGKVLTKVDTRAMRALMDMITENATDSEKLITELTEITNKAIKKLYPTMDDMEKAYKGLKAGEKPTARTVAMAERWTRLAPLSRSINKFERAWAKPFYRFFNSIFAMVYMGFSPGYAMRNMLSNTVAYCADMSWGVAGEELIKGFSSGVWAQIPEMFKPGMASARRVASVKEIMGFVPDFMLKGIGAVGGEARMEQSIMEKASLFTRVASRAESGMSAEIVEKAIKRELGRALKNGALPGVDSLVQAGMSQKNANLFFQAVVDNWGDVGKASKQFVGEMAKKGEQTVLVETWRHMAVPKRFQGFMESISLWDSFKNIRRTARNEQEFVEKFGDLWNEVRRLSGMGTVQHPTLPIDAPEAVVAAAEEELMHTMKPSASTLEANEVFRQAYVAFREGKMALEKGVSGILSRLRDVHPLAVDWQALDARLVATKDEHLVSGVYDMKNGLLDTTWKWNDMAKAKVDPKALWEMVSFRGKNLGVAPENLTTRDFLDSLWKFYRETTNGLWTDYNTKYQADMWAMLLDTISEIEGKIGSKIVLRPDEVEALAEAKRIFYQAEAFSKSMTWEQAKRTIRMATPSDAPSLWFKDGVVPEAATIDDLHPFYLRAFGWDKGKKALINAVNSDRALKGLPPVAAGEKIAFTEAVDALRRRVRQTSDMTPEVLREMTAKVDVLRQLNEADYTKVIDYVYRNAATKERKALKQLMSDLQEAGRTHGNLGVPINTADVWTKLEQVAGDIVKRIDTEFRKATELPEALRTERDALEVAMSKPGADVEKLRASIQAIDNQSMSAAEGLTFGDANRLLKPVDDAMTQAYEKVVASTENMPSIERALLDQFDDFTRDARRVLAQTIDQWGVVERQMMNDNLRAAMGKWKDVADSRVAEAKAFALLVAREQRDFILHPYWDKTYADLALSHIYPYQYWYNRSYMNWAQRLVFNPKIAAGYAKYRRTLERAHAGMPTWWKYNISTRDLPGMAEGDELYDNPLYFNLEATFNPINGLTGVDFNDPNRRVNWYTSMIDDMGKYGASLFTPINWMVAGALWSESEAEFANGDLVSGNKDRDASQRWLGRLMPQTATLETFLGWAGIELPWGGYEVDPFVRAMGGHDPYETRRIVRYLAGMPNYTPEQSLDAAYKQDGQAWDDAVRGSLSDRWWGQAASFLFGVGFKPRTAEDMQIDAFYQEYFSVLSMSDSMTPLEYQGAMEGLRQKYPFMDTVLLGRKADYFRDGAYAYTILSRVPPGQMDQVTEAVGITPELVDQFYKDKGLFDKWLPGDVQRFMAAIVDIAAVYSIPTYSTKVQWLEAKSHYYVLRDELVKQFGVDIWDKIDIYYQLNAGGSYQEQQQAERYIEGHPEVAAALDYKTHLVVSDPILNAYYGGIDTIERYEMSKIYTILDVKHPGVRDLWQQYYDLQQMDEVDGTKTASAFKKKHKKELEAYSKEKKQLMANLQRSLEAFASVMDQPELGSLRSDWGTSQTNQTQQQVAAIVNPPPALTWEQYSQEISVPIQRVVIDYYLNGVELPYSTSGELDYLAGQFGFRDGDELLLDLGRAIRKENEDYLRLLVPER
jgi:hypothetical protein